MIELVKLGIFVVFGSLLTLGALFVDGWAAVGIAALTLLLVRPIALFVSLAGTRQVGAEEKAFMSWFGPKGVATMTFSLFVLGAGLPAGDEIFHLAAVVVLCSIVAHGLTDRPGAELLARRAERRAGASEEGDRKAAAAR